MNKKLVYIVFIVGVITAGLSSSYSVVKAATTATVTATVTVQNISVTVSDGTVAYGTLGVNSSAGTNASDTQTATNNGNITEDILMKGNDSANWTLASEAGTDEYVHRFCISSCGSAPTSYTALTTSYQDVKEDLAASGTQTFDLHITTPTASTNFTQQSVDVTILATTPD